MFSLIYISVDSNPSINISLGHWYRVAYHGGGGYYSKPGSRERQDGKGSSDSFAECLQLIKNFLLDPSAFLLFWAKVSWILCWLALILSFAKYNFELRILLLPLWNYRYTRPCLIYAMLWNWSSKHPEGQGNTLPAKLCPQLRHHLLKTNNISQQDPPGDQVLNIYPGRIYYSYLIHNRIVPDADVHW